MPSARMSRPSIRGALPPNSFSQSTRSSARDNCRKLSISISPLRWLSIEPPLMDAASLLTRVCAERRDRSGDRALGRGAQSRCLASALALARGILHSDAVDPLAASLLRHQREAELLAHHAREEPAHRVGLPA